VSEVRHATVRVPATTANLGPGFDAFGLALAHHLVVRSRPRRDDRPRVTTTGDGADEVATGDDNLVWRSLVTFCEAYDRGVPDVRLEVANDVPLERGLGSSSAAIVAGLVLGREVTGHPVGDRDLVRLADRIEGHPDNVAPALFGGLVACATDDAGRLVVRRRNPAPHLRPIVLVPATRQATQQARGVLPERLDRDDVVVQAARAGHVLGALVGAWPVDPQAAGDRLHEPPRLRVMPASGAVVAGLRAGGVHAWLSGAGPSVAGLLDGAAPAGRALAGRVAAEHGFTVHDLRVDLAGALVCPDDGCALSGMATTCAQCPRQRI